MQPLADIGINLTDKRFQPDLDDVLSRAAAAGVRWQLITGTDVASSRAALALAQAHENLFCTAGLHPHQAREFTPSLLGDLEALAGHEKVRAIGETGLDFNRDFSPRPIQETAFAAQLELAATLQRPVFLHQRDAHERFLPILKDYRAALPDAVVHCFTGSRRELFDYLDLDCHIGITGWLCDERRGGELRQLVHNIPSDRLLVETDGPYLLPRDLPGKPPVRGRNEPALLPWIVRQLAACRDEAPETVAQATYENSCRVFSVSILPA
ncbi:TatD family hydrolase [Alcanivorax quisquiliarum]|uniref:TatD family hydrolase n=1 Tax=Alcanivorax quisquiliarum TaxID=2933565 RepID=A0ABT0E3Z0_9GAMM|nr:TatD family hydrolase [Alcanivorax quisquiliarum]MCK0536524.1 TatD family hydrolase [Alcanivorax quisquiliarum]